MLTRFLLLAKQSCCPLTLIPLDPEAGVEPATSPLHEGRSTLSYSGIMVRLLGAAPSAPIWKIGELAGDSKIAYLEANLGLEPSAARYKGAILAR